MFEFNDDCKQAFITLKRELIAYPVLRFVRPSRGNRRTHRCMRTRAILLQKQRDKSWAPTAYFSRPTNETESRYHSYELEMLAVVKAVERFHIYLHGIQFKIVTDCNALVYATKKANLNPRISRWILALQNYSFEVVHRPGGKMAHLDALSWSMGVVNELAIERRLELLQLADPELQDISRKLEMGDDPKFTLIDGLVYRKLGNDCRFVVPNSMVHNILRIYHDDVAHCGARKTLEGITSHYWFPHMRKRVHDYISNCITCLTMDEASNRLEHETFLSDSPKTLMEIVHGDHFDPLTTNQT